MYAGLNCSDFVEVQRQYRNEWTWLRQVRAVEDGKRIDFVGDEMYAMLTAKPQTLL
jgi:hypothetical protein